MSAGEIMLYVGLKEASWNLVEQQSAPFSRSSEQVVTWGEPYWEFEAKYQNLTDADFRALRAWTTRRRGASITFSAYDPSRQKPVLGLPPNHENVSLASVDIGAGTITLQGLGTHVISPGDMIGYSTSDDGLWVGEALETATPVSGAATVDVYPAPRTPHATTPDARIFQALGRFRMIGMPSLIAPHDRRRSVSFKARQVIEG